MEHIGIARKALQDTGRRHRRWTWVWVLLLLMALFANLGLSVGMAVTRDQRLAEIEHRVELAMQGREQWQGDLATSWSDLGTEVADLRGALTDLRTQVGGGDADLRNALDALGERVVRIEGMVAAQWQSRANAARGGGVITAPLPRPGPRATDPEFDGGADEQSPIW